MSVNDVTDADRDHLRHCEDLIADFVARHRDSDGGATASYHKLLRAMGVDPRIAQHSTLERIL